MSFLQRVAACSLRVREWSSVIQEWLQLEWLLQYIKGIQLRWFGHLVRMPQLDLNALVLLRRSWRILLERGKSGPSFFGCCPCDQNLEKLNFMDGWTLTRCWQQWQSSEKSGLNPRCAQNSWPEFKKQKPQYVYCKRELMHVSHLSLRCWEFSFPNQQKQKLSKGTDSWNRKEGRGV